MFKQDSILKGHIIYQIENNGKTSDERLDSIKGMLTASASALRAAMLELEGSAGNTGDEDSKKETVSTASTKTFTFEIRSGKAFEALQKLDSEQNTEAYDAKMSALNSVRDEYNLRHLRNPKGRQLNELPLSERVEATEKLNKVGFMSYSWQVFIQIPQPNGSGVKTIKSKKHHRLQSMSDSSIKDVINSYVEKWVVKPKSDSQPDDTIEGSSSLSGESSN